jgi:hypothetical protein
LEGDDVFDPGEGVGLGIHDLGFETIRLAHFGPPCLPPVGSGVTWFGDWTSEIGASDGGDSGLGFGDDFVLCCVGFRRMEVWPETVFFVGFLGPQASPSSRLRVNFKGFERS